MADQQQEQEQRREQAAEEQATSTKAAQRARAKVKAEDAVSGRAPVLPEVQPRNQERAKNVAAAEERLAKAEAERHAAAVELYAAQQGDPQAEDAATAPVVSFRRLRGLSSRQISQLDPSVRDQYQGGYLLAQTTRTRAEQAQEALAAVGRVVTTADAERIFADEYGEDALDQLVAPGVSEEE